MSPLRSAFHDPDSRSYRWVNGTVWVLIIVSVLLFVQEISQGRVGTIGSLLNTLDWVILIIFAVEITLRIGTYSPPELRLFAYPPHRRLRTEILSRIRYALEPLNLIDIVTVLALVPILRGLRAFRLLRLLRSVKIFRYGNPFQGVTRAFEESRILFLAAFSFLGTTTAIGGLTIYLIEGSGLSDTPNKDIHTVADGLWWAIVTLTTVGFGDIAPVSSLGRLVGAVLMVIGMFTLALFAGIVGRTLLNSVLSIREDSFRMSGYTNHLVICGFDAGTEMLLDTIRRHIDIGKHPIVIFDPGERPRSVPPDFIWVTGDPTKESEFPKVRLTHAHGVIIVGARDSDPQSADAHTILTCFTIRRFLKLQKDYALRKSPLYLVCEILSTENVDHAYTAGADEVIESTRIGFSMLSHAMSFPGTAAVIAQVAEDHAPSLFVGQLYPAGEEPSLPFSELAARLKVECDILAIGVIDPKTQQRLLNPPGTLPVTRGTDVVYLGPKAIEPSPS